MKIALGFLFLSVLAMISCSSPGGGGNANVPPDFKGLSADNYKEESTLTADDYRSALSQISPRDCSQSAFNGNLAGSTFRIETSSFSQGVMTSSKKNVQIVSVAALEVQTENQDEAFFSSVISGSYFVNNRSASVCILDPQSMGEPKCVETGEYTQAAKDYLASRSGQTDPQFNCQFGDAQSWETRYSRGTYTLGDGRKVAAVMEFSDMTFTQVCNGVAGPMGETIETKIFTGETFEYPNVIPCTPTKLYSRFVGKSASALVTDTSFKILSAPSRF